VEYVERHWGYYQSHPLTLVGLLSAGNEEMARFAWKAFQKWQVRQDHTEKDKAQKRDLLDFMCAFRETFSRPVHRIRFLGLFDTVNSVPRFENAMMQRSKFPYTARSTAKVIRHAVAIDERRAKFRQDLISELKQAKETPVHRYRHRRHHVSELFSGDEPKEDDEKREDDEEEQSRGRPSIELKTNDPVSNSLNVPENFRDASEVSGIRSRSPNISAQDDDRASIMTSVSRDSLSVIRHTRGDFWDSDSEEQDIKEVWFPGCHADIGGGWPLEEGEAAALSHVPLVWMVREAERAGLRFDPVKLRALNCAQEEQPHRIAAVPQIEIEGASPSPEFDDSKSTGKSSIAGPSTFMAAAPEKTSRFHHHIHNAAVKGRIHDVLQFKNGVPAMSVVSWNLMEYLPFRRMVRKMQAAILRGLLINNILGSTTRWELEIYYLASAER
jgi:hypothetical protein